jgi:hypothetical protein
MPIHRGWFRTAPTCAVPSQHEGGLQGRGNGGFVAEDYHHFHDNLDAFAAKPAVFQSIFG